MPCVEVLRPFANGHHDDIVQPGDIIDVSEDRRKDLGDLVREVASEKAAPAPANKMAPAPANKVATDEPVMPFRRGPGRPPGAKSTERR